MRYLSSVNSRDNAPQARGSLRERDFREGAAENLWLSRADVFNNVHYYAGSMNYRPRPPALVFRTRVGRVESPELKQRDLSPSIPNPTID